MPASKKIGISSFQKFRESQIARASHAPWLQGQWNCLMPLNEIAVNQNRE